MGRVWIHSNEAFALEYNALTSMLSSSLISHLKSKSSNLLWAPAIFALITYTNAPDDDDG